MMSSLWAGMPGKEDHYVQRVEHQRTVRSAHLSTTGHSPARDIVDPRVPKKELSRAQVSGATIDQGHLRAPHRVRREFQWVEADAAYPFGDETRILARRQVSIGTAPAREQVLARLATGHAKIVVESLAGHLSQLEPDRPAGLSLADIGAVNSVAVGCHVIDPDRDEIATSQLAVDRQVEQRQVARAALQLQLGPDGPYVSWPQRRLWAREFALIPGRPTRPCDL